MPEPALKYLATIPFFNATFIRHIFSAWYPSHGLGKSITNAKLLAEDR
jgi:hypothetical protein